MIKSKNAPFQRGYRRGYLAARAFVIALRARVARGNAVAPNELGHLLERHYRRIDAAGGRAMAQRPISQRTAAYQSRSGEYFGFCAGLIDVLIGL